MTCTGKDEAVGTNSPPPPPPQDLIEDFDDVLEHVGGWGKFQITLLLISLPFNMLFAYATFAPILVLYVPDQYHCSVDPALVESGNWTVEALEAWYIPRSEEARKCKMYDRLPPPPLFESESLLPGGGFSELPHPSVSGGHPPLQEIPCQHGWTYNLTGLFRSAVTDMDWVCEDEWRGPFTQSMAFLGAVFGATVFGKMADKYGRYPIFVLTNAILLVTGIVTPFCADFVSFTLLRVLMGATFYTFYTLIYVLVLEFVSVEKRSVIGNLGLAIGISVGGAIEPWILKALGDWKPFHIALFAQAAIVFITPLFVHESVRWLAERGEAEKCIAILKKIAKTNGREVRQEVYDAYEDLVREQYEEIKEEPETSFLQALKLPRLRKNLILAVMTWMLATLVFDGHVRNIVNLKYDIYMTFTIAALLEFPGDLITIYAVDYLGRRWAAFITLILSSVFMLACAFVLDNTVALMVFSMVGRFFVTISMNTAFQVTFEIMPTVIRGQGGAIANALGNLLALLSPYIAYSDAVHPALPFYILSALGVVCAVVAVNLSETADEKLANTLEEGEAFGKGQPFFFMPVMNYYCKGKSGKVDDGDIAATEKAHHPNLSATRSVDSQSTIFEEDLNLEESTPVPRKPSRTRRQSVALGAGRTFTGAVSTTRRESLSSRRSVASVGSGMLSRQNSRASSSATTAKLVFLPTLFPPEEKRSEAELPVDFVAKHRRVGAMRTKSDPGWRSRKSSESSEGGGHRRPRRPRSLHTSRQSSAILALGGRVGVGANGDNGGGADNSASNSKRAGSEVGLIRRLSSRLFSALGGGRQDEAENASDRVEEEEADGVDDVSHAPHGLNADL